MDIELEYIPIEADRTIVLAGMYMRNSSYAIKIGLFPGELPRETREMAYGSPDQFRYLRLMHQLGESSIFDLIEGWS